MTPKYLVVGPELETAAEQILATLAAAKVEDQNVFAGKLALIVEPRIEDGSWYVFGDQTTAPVLEIATLASAPGPQIESREGWDVLGREFRVVHDLGVGITDFRGAYRKRWRLIMSPAARLQEAETALHALMTGRAVVTVTDENGESVTYTRAKTSDLQAYIRDLTALIAGGRRRVTKIHFITSKGI